MGGFFSCTLQSGIILIHSYWLKRNRKLYVFRVSHPKLWGGGGMTSVRPNIVLQCVIST